MTTNFQQSVLTKLSLAIVAAGGSVPVPSQTNFEQYVLDLLDELNVSIAGIGGGAGGGGTPADLTYTLSQSSVYQNQTAACQGSYANMTDTDLNTGAGTNSASITGNEEWIQADLGSLKFVDRIGVQAGTLGGGFGSVSGYLTAQRIELSTDGLAWSFAMTIQQTNSGLMIWHSIGAYARYVRLKSTGSWIGCNELRITGY